jgi:hypothetical protein
MQYLIYKKIYEMQKKMLDEKIFELKNIRKIMTKQDMANSFILEYVT